MFRSVLVLALCVAVLGLSQVMAAEINNGTVEYTGEERTQGIGPDAAAAKHVVPNGYVNNGKVTATGKDEEGDGTSDTWYGGSGIWVNAGGFVNHGDVNAFGGKGLMHPYPQIPNPVGGTGGTGIFVTGDFDNYNTVTATGGEDGGGIGGNGILVWNGDFNNYGSVTATGGMPSDESTSFNPGDGIVINEGSFINEDYLLARGGIGGYGIYIVSPNVSTGIGFDNAGMLVISSPDGGQASLSLNNASQTAIFRNGSTLALLAGGRIDVNAATTAGAFTNTLTIDSGARLISLEALKTDSAETKHENFITNAITGADVSVYENSTSPLVTVAFTKAPAVIDGTAFGENLTATFTRKTGADGNLLYASDIVSGSAGEYMSSLEGLVVGNADAIDPDDPRFFYAMLYADIEQQPTGEDVAAKANALFTNARGQVDPQGAATALPSFNTASRLAGSVFSDRLRLAATLPDDAVAVGASLSGLSGNAYAAIAPAGTRHGAVAWATPFFQQGDLDGSSGRGDLRERMGGVALGGALLRGDWAFGLSAHILDVDLDGSGGYDADATGYGLNLGLARRFCLGSLAPWFELTGGYTYYDFDQKRHGVDLLGNRETYRSDPNVHVVNASALLSNAFDFGRFTLTPRIGADYARADMNAYNERGGSTVPYVKSKSYDSFRSVLGATVSVQATPRIRFEVRGDYYHEFADTKSRFTARDSFGLISVNARSQDAGRESGRLGAGVHWRPTDRVELGLDYDLHLGKKYVGHRVSAQLKLAF